jgi:hypothetical protein
MALRTTILWIHAISGAAWVAACGCFVIAGLALETGSEEQRSFVARVAPKIDRMMIAAAALVLVTGAVNLVLAGVARRFHFSAAFAIVLGIKIVLFIVMTLALGATLRTDGAIDALIERGRSDAVPGALARMVRYHGAIAAMGGVALLLGLWLMGT